MEYYFHQNKTIKLGVLADYMWDRCQVINPTNNIRLLTPLGKVNDIDFFLECTKRAEFFARLDVPVWVLWSGGLDSTAVFLLLREVLPANRLKVLYTNKSLFEYPGFFETNIHPYYETYKFEMDLLGEAIDNFSKQGLLVTGEIGDQLFGSSWLTALPIEGIKSDWRAYNSGKLLKIPRIEEFINSCPQTLKSAGEVLWWFNYAMKYQYVQVRMLLDNGAILNKHLYHFFDTQGFNDYAVSTPLEEKMPGFDVAKYKQPLREVINTLSGDSNYAFNKPKVQSWAPSNPTIIKAIAIDTDWNRYYADN